MPLSIQDLIKVVEKAKQFMYVVQRFSDGDRAKDVYYIDAKILIQELKKMEE